MIKRLLLIVLILELHVSASNAGKIADVFSNEIFGIKWGSSLKQVSEVFRNGKSKKLYGIQTYTVRDGRTLFEIERKPENYIQFVFNAQGQLHGVNIEFPNGTDGFGTLLNRLNTYFGPHEFDPHKKSATVAEWPEDDGFKISMMHVPGLLNMGEIVFTIRHLKADTPVTKEKLGF